MESSHCVSFLSASAFRLAMAALPPWAPMHRLGPTGVRFMALVPEHPRSRWQFRHLPQQVTVLSIVQGNPKEMTLSQLVAHGTEGACRWRMQNLVFWESFFGRLRELQDEVGLSDAVRILVIVSHLQFVDLEVIDHCEKVLLESPSEALLDIKEQDIFDVVLALSTMGRPAAMPAVLRPLVARVHRLDPDLVLRLLGAALKVSSPGAGELAAAAASHAVEGNAPAAFVASLTEVISKLAALGLCRTGPKSSLQLLVKHALRRARDGAPEDFPAAELDRVLAASRAVTAEVPEAAPS